MTPKVHISCLVALASMLTYGCGRSERDAASRGEAPAQTESSAAAAFPGMEADLARTLKEQADFYVFKTAEDFAAETKDLKWEDGSENPEFADINAPKGGTMRIWIQDFPRTLRTVGPDATGGIRPFQLDYTQPSLVHMHPNVAGAYYPGCTSGWAVSRETKTVYFKLDPAARWSDGVPLTTDDIVYTYYMMRSPLLNEPWYNDYFTKTFSRLTVYDKSSFALTLREWKPDAVARAGVENVPYPRHAFQDFGPDWLNKYQWRLVPTLAPYVLTEDGLEKGVSVTFTHQKDWWAENKRFWRGRYNPEKLRLVVIRDVNKAFEAFRRGDIDMMGLGTPTFWYEKLPDDDPLVQSGYICKAKFFNRTPQPDWGLWINRSKPDLDNRDLREGIQYATNFELVCKQYFRGDAVVMNTRSDGYGWRMHPTMMHRPFDPAKAREYFAKAGFTQQGPDGVLMTPNGRRLFFELTAYRTPSVEDVLSILKQEALKAGLELVINIGDQATAWKKVQEKNHQIAFIALSRSVELYPRYWEMHHGSNAYVDAYLDANGQPVDLASKGTPNPKPTKIRVQTNNMTETFIPELDRLIERYEQAETLDEIKDLARRIEEIIHDDAAWVPGYAQPFLRGGYWRWVKWPEDFNVASARDLYESFVFAIDTKLEADVRAARKDGRTFPAEVRVFDKYKQD